MRHLLTALALALPAPALSQGYADLPPPPPPQREANDPALGLRLDVGVPDGVVAALVYRPVRSVRFSGGAAWNALGFGYQLGVGLVPFRLAVTPSLNLDYGHYFDADATFVGRQANVAPEVAPLLRSVAYDYVSGLVGLELGSPRGVSFSVKAGLSYLWTRVHGAAESIQSAGGGDAVVRVEDPRVRATLPTVKLGLLIYF
jgi:hypothetical protein